MKRAALIATFLFILTGCSSYQRSQSDPASPTRYGSPQGSLDPVLAAGLVTDALLEGVLRKDEPIPSHGFCSVREESLNVATRCPSVSFTLIDTAGREIGSIRTDANGVFQVPPAYRSSAKIRLRSRQFVLDRTETRGRGARDTTLYVYLRPASLK